MKGTFVMVDGLDNSGKGTVIEGLKEWALAKGLKVLDLRDYAQANNSFPEDDELSGFDAICSVEPSHAYIGKAIRDEMIRAGNRQYNALSIMHAFSLDREILYKRVIIPALKQGKYVFQERGVITSIVYQPVQIRLPLSEIIRLPGNSLALMNAPDLLLITNVAPEIVMERMKENMKKDRAIFEELSFQRKVDLRYKSDWLRSIFERRNSKIVYIDNNPPKTANELKEETRKIFDEFLEKR